MHIAITAILDLIFIGILIISIWSGYKKGLIMGIGGIVAIIVSIYGANLISSTFSNDFAPILHPFISGYMQPRINDVTYLALGYEQDENGDFNADRSADDLLEENPSMIHIVCMDSFKSIGIFTSAAELLADEAVDYSATNAVPIQTAIIEVLCQRGTYVVGFILIFILIVIVFTVIGNIPNLSYKIPYIGLANDILGVVFGVFTGIMYCCLLAWAMKFTGILVSEDTIADTIFSKLFFKMDFLSRFIGI